MFPNTSFVFQPGATTHPPSAPVRSNYAMPDNRPKWFITRGPGVYTALIPVDELPISIKLHGVSRRLSVEQLVGMSFVAEAGPLRKRFLLDANSAFPMASSAEIETMSPQSPAAAAFTAPDAHLYVSSSPSSAVATADTSLLPETPSPTRDLVSCSTPHVLAPQKSAAAVNTESYYPPQRPLPPSGQEPDESKKKFCSYWLHHGSCDYTQQGCKYKHEMPSDLNELKELGFRHWPRWYVEDQAAIKARSERTDASRECGLDISTPRLQGQAGLLLTAGPHQQSIPSLTNGAALVHHEAKIRRSRRTDKQAIGVLTCSDAANKAVPTPVSRLTPPAIIASPSKSAASPPKSILTKAAANEQASPKTVTETLNLIDLSDTEDEETSAAPSTSAAGASSIKPAPSLQSPSRSMSTSSSVSNGVIEPQTPPAAVVGPVSSPTGKGIFVPRGESPISHQKRFRNQQQQRPGKKRTRRLADRTTTSTGRRGNGATSGGPSKPESALPTRSTAPSKQKTLTGLDASVHAVQPASEESSIKSKR